LTATRCAVNLPLMDLTQHLLKTAKAFAESREISMARLATIVMNDGKFFQRVEAGKTLTVKTYEKVLAQFVAQGFPVEPICIPPGITTRKQPKGFKLRAGDQVVRFDKGAWQRILITKDAA
jgi:hypothetical protein